MLKFTRHAKRRMRLYNISKEEVKDVVDCGEKMELSDGKIAFIYKLHSKNLPVKVICKYEENYYLIISCYPLRKGN